VPLHHAVHRKDGAFTKMLLEHGADPNMDTKSWLHPLHLAVEADQPINVQLLLEYHADINVQDNRGRTALHHVGDLRINNNMPIPKAEYESPCTLILLEAGIDLNIRDKDGLTAKELWERRGFTKIVSTIMAYETAFLIKEPDMDSYQSSTGSLIGVPDTISNRFI
jgi:ankyrin repeat protein